MLVTKYLKIAGFLLLVAIVCGNRGYAQDAGEGIVFTTGTWDDAMALSKKEGKPIFIDVYATWCGPCKAMSKRTFSKSKVGDFFNAAFINVAINGETEIGRVIIHNYEVRAYPTLLFIDHHGHLLKGAEGYQSVKSLIALGKSVVD